MPMINPSAKVPLGQHLLQLLRLKSFPPICWRVCQSFTFALGCTSKTSAGARAAWSHYCSRFWPYSWSSKIDLSKAMDHGNRKTSDGSTNPIIPAIRAGWISPGVPGSTSPAPPQGLPTRFCSWYCCNRPLSHSEVSRLRSDMFWECHGPQKMPPWCGNSDSDSPSLRMALWVLHISCNKTTYLLANLPPMLLALDYYCRDMQAK